MTSTGKAQRVPNRGDSLLSSTIMIFCRLAWATSGQRAEKLDARTFRYVATNVRDFNIAASPSWKTTVGRSVNGRTWW